MENYPITRFAVSCIVPGAALAMATIEKTAADENYRKNPSAANLKIPEEKKRQLVLESAKLAVPPMVGALMSGADMVHRHLTKTDTDENH